MLAVTTIPDLAHSPAAISSQAIVIAAITVMNAAIPTIGLRREIMRQAFHENRYRLPRPEYMTCKTANKA